MTPISRMVYCRGSALAFSSLFAEEEEEEEEEEEDAAAVDCFGWCFFFSFLLLWSILFIWRWRVWFFW